MRKMGYTTTEIEYMTKIQTAMMFEDGEVRNETLIKNTTEGIAVHLAAFSEAIGKPLIVNASYRSLEHEKRRGRSGGSSHVWDVNVNMYGKGSNGFAIDISHMNLSKHETMHLIDLAMDSGEVCRICRYDTFIHMEFYARTKTKLYKMKSGRWHRVSTIEQMW